MNKFIMYLKIWFGFFQLILYVFLGIQCLSSQNLLSERQKEIKKALDSKFPVILLYSPSDSIRYLIQSKFVSLPNLQSLYIDKISNNRMLNEIFSISEARPSDIPLSLRSLTTKQWYRVELYNYSLNSSVVALYNGLEDKFVELKFFKEMQVDIPPHLEQLAIYIAKTDPEVKRVFGENLKDKDIRMESTKSALNRSKCQRSLHLCVAPTFVYEDKALWTIVDLTELKTVGVKWTTVGYTGPSITERLVQNEKMMSCYCTVKNKIERDDWKFDYTLTRSDGLELTNISYKGQEIIKTVKTLDWHVSYSNTDGFGYSDAIGCPEYSQAAVVAIEPPSLKPIVENGDTIGFVLSQKYFSEGWPTPCSYNYEQVFEFYRNGNFRPVIGSLGRGCGNNAIYRPVTRIGFSGEQNRVFLNKWNEKNEVKQESWILENELTPYQDSFYIGEIESKDRDFKLRIESNKGQFHDGGRGDQAYYYFMKYHQNIDEGESDFPTLGPCCNTDHKQGPEVFLNDENLENSGIVLWYVPVIRNDSRPGNEYCWAESILENGIYVPKVYPCYSGLKFHLIAQ